MLSNYLFKRSEIQLFRVERGAAPPFKMKEKSVKSYLAILFFKFCNVFFHKDFQFAVSGTGVIIFNKTKKEYDGYDCLRYELLETLIPAMLYKGTEKERDEFFGFLKQDGKTFIHDMYQTLCEDEGLPYPYENSDFEVRIFERGGVNILQILLPS